MFYMCIQTLMLLRSKFARGRISAATVTVTVRSQAELIALILILIVIRLSGVGLRGEQLKQGAPDFPFPGHIDQL
jgi:hypothetical protein